MMQTCLKRPENLNYNKTWFMKAISLGDNFMAMLELLYIYHTAKIKRVVF